MSRTRKPAFSRSGVTSPFGKCDDRLEAQGIESIVKDELKKQAATENLPFADYLRRVLWVAAFGVDEVKKLHNQQIERIGKKLGR